MKKSEFELIHSDLTLMLHGVGIPLQNVVHVPSSANFHRFSCNPLFPAVSILIDFFDFFIFISYLFRLFSWLTFISLQWTHTRSWGRHCQLDQCFHFQTALASDHVTNARSSARNWHLNRSWDESLLMFVGGQYLPPVDFEILVSLVFRIFWFFDILVFWFIFGFLGFWLVILFSLVFRCN